MTAQKHLARWRAGRPSIHPSSIVLGAENLRLLYFKDQPTLNELSTYVGISPSHLQRTFKRVVGVTPAAYRRGGTGMRIEYVIVNCPLGRLLVAATPNGICAVSIDDSDEALEVALREEYPEAECIPDGHRLTPWVRAILDHLKGQQPRLDLPLDLRATAFQRRRWQELQRIPYGQTCSYSEIAKAINRPKATRAVARSCATNPVPSGRSFRREPRGLRSGPRAQAGLA